MSRRLSLLFITVLSLSVLLAGCGKDEQAESEPASSTSVPAETSLEAVSSAEPETSGSQPDVIVSEQSQQPASSAASRSQTTDSETMEENSAMNRIVQAESRPASSTSVPVETSSETVSSAEPEASESQPDVIVSEQPQEPASSSASQSQTTDGETMEEENCVMNMIVQVNGSTFTATLEENAAVDALVKMMEQGPVTIQMRDYSGFEKVGSLGTSLPTSNSQTTAHAGDIVLYQGNQIVMFYGSNSWSYTRLGHIDDLTGWEEALGSGDVTVTFSLED